MILPMAAGKVGPLRVDHTLVERMTGLRGEHSHLGRGTEVSRILPRTTGQIQGVHILLGHVALALANLHGGYLLQIEQILKLSPALGITVQ